MLVGGVNNFFWGFEFVGARVLEFGSEWCLVVLVLVIDDFVG